MDGEDQEGDSEEMEHLNRGVQDQKRMIPIRFRRVIHLPRMLVPFLRLTITPIYEQNAYQDTHSK